MLCIKINPQKLDLSRLATVQAVRQDLCSAGPGSKTCGIHPFVMTNKDEKGGSTGKWMKKGSSFVICYPG